MNLDQKQVMLGDTAQTVFYNGKPVALAGSATSSGATIVDPPKDRNIYIEGRLIAYEGDFLSDGTALLPIKKDSN